MSIDRREKEKNKFGSGNTLLEVLAALAVFTLIVAAGSRLLPRVWQSAGALQERCELQYALVKGGQTVAKAIRAAQAVEWQEKTLSVLPGPVNKEQVIGKSAENRFYIADKDHNGEPDLYREHLGVPNPVATGIVALECDEVGPGLWHVLLVAGKDGVSLKWETFVRQRVKTVDLTPL